MKKVLKLKLEPEVHEKFRSWAFNHRVTMQGELENYVGGLVDGSVPKTPAVPRKQPSVRSYEVKKVEVAGGWSEAPTDKIGVPVDPSEVPMAKCRKCGEPFPVADMVTEPKTGRLFCHDCVENMKNNQ